MMGYTFLPQNLAAPSESSTASFIYAYHHPSPSVNDFPERPPSPLRRCAPASFRKDMKRIKWTEDLHLHFLKAVEKLGPKAVPSRILHHMGAKAAGLTRNQIASHLQKYRTDLEALKKSMNEKKNARKKQRKNATSAVPTSSAKSTTATTSTTTSLTPEVPLAIVPHPVQTPLLAVDNTTAVTTSPQHLLSPSTTLATTVLTTPEPSYGREILDKSFYYSVPVLDFENDEICRFAFEELITTILEGQPQQSTHQAETSYVSHVL
eukprot:TRINITY_DN2419_c0_g5_i1.p1 TRINITY_DN2419_c0_g5~~TRINITY_DN2419_c0_g5_i1.p1  ORF type:complete len:305 (+),score=51.39 TRINITY_DN2419_c0_g5_i1:124-915(+)